MDSRLNGNDCEDPLVGLPGSCLTQGMTAAMP